MRKKHKMFMFLSQVNCSLHLMRSLNTPQVFSVTVKMFLTGLKHTLRLYKDLSSAFSQCDKPASVTEVITEQQETGSETDLTRTS